MAFNRNKDHHEIKIYNWSLARKTGRINGRGWRWKFWPFVKEKQQLIPRNPDNDKLTDLEIAIVNVEQRELHRVEQWWSYEDKILKAKYCETTQLYFRAKEKLEKEESEVTEPKEKFKVADEQFKLVDIPPVLSAGKGLLIITILAIFEYPLNAVVFEIFGETQIFTYLFAILPSIALGFCSHFLGMALKQKEKSPVNKMFIVIMPLLFIGVLLVFAVARAKFMGETQSSLPQNLRLSDSERLLIFFILNIFLMGVATWISYLASRENISIYKRKLNEYIDTKMKLEKESSEAVAAKENFDRIEILRQNIKTNRESVHKKYINKAEQIISVSNNLILEYRQHNQESRARYNNPECTWGVLPTLSIPQKLIDMDWICNFPVPKHEDEHNQMMNKEKKPI